MNERLQWLEKALKHISSQERKGQPLIRVVTGLLTPKKEFIKYVDEKGQFIMIDPNQGNPEFEKS